MTATALTIAGSDSGGGAGIQADLKTFSALGVYGSSVITAITAQNTRAVTAVSPVALDVVAAQLDAVLSDIRVDAVKIGMLFSPELIEIVARGLAGFDGPVVLDPVMVAKSGDALLQDDAVAALIAHLLPRATLVTPNLPEAARLTGGDTATTSDSAAAQGRRILDLGARAVLVKGGHAEGPVCTDFLLCGDDAPIELTSGRVETGNTHGTGCTYSSAIAAFLARGEGLESAVRAAHSYLNGAIRAADGLEIGGGHGPVHHFHAVWA